MEISPPSGRALSTSLSSQWRSRSLSGFCREHHHNKIQLRSSQYQSILTVEKKQSINHNIASKLAFLSKMLCIYATFTHTLASEGQMITFPTKMEIIWTKKAGSLNRRPQLLIFIYLHLYNVLIRSDVLGMYTGDSHGANKPQHQKMNGALDWNNVVLTLAVKLLCGYLRTR